MINMNLDLKKEFHQPQIAVINCEFSQFHEYLCNSLLKFYSDESVDFFQKIVFSPVQYHSSVNQIIIEQWAYL